MSADWKLNVVVCLASLRTTVPSSILYVTWMISYHEECHKSETTNNEWAPISHFTSVTFYRSGLWIELQNYHKRCVESEMILCTHCMFCGYFLRTVLLGCFPVTDPLDRDIYYIECFNKRSRHIHRPAELLHDGGMMNKTHYFATMYSPYTLHICTVGFKH